MPHQCTGCGQTFEDGSKEMLSGCPECGGNTFQFRPTGATAGDDASSNPTVAADSDPPDPPARPESASSSVAETVGRATTKVRDFVSSDPAASRDSDSRPNPNASWPNESTENPDTAAENGPTNPSVSSGESGGEIIDADARRERRGDDEDVAQASARTDLVDSKELETSASTLETDIDDETDTDTDPAAEFDAESGSEAPANPAAPDGRVVSEPSGENPDIADLREQLNDQFESIKIVEPGQYELNLMELYDREEYIIALQENGRYVIQVPEQWMGDEPGER